ncbi:MAG TPA: NAD(P)H-binding protein [Polyangiaceae bacterium]|nr:NAD(P)H-binding protein [Polyangiaceae bacterium]
MSQLALSSRPILVLGATGTVGREVVRALRARDATVLALVRSQASAAALPPGVGATLGDLGDVAAVQGAVGRAGAVFFVNPHEADEELYAENVLSACERAGVRLVFVGVHVDARWKWLRALLRALYGSLFPHYKPRFRIGERVFSAGTKTQLLLASPFYQNDEVFHPDVLEGRYTQPLGTKGITGVDVRDIGEIAAKLLVEEGHPAGCYPVTGPSPVSGPEAAAIWTEALGRPVTYAGHEPAMWTRAISTRLTGRKREDWLKTYRALAKMSGGPNPVELARTAEMLGRAPYSYRDYVNRVVGLTRPASR